MGKTQSCCITRETSTLDKKLLIKLNKHKSTKEDEIEI